jgi:RecA-family ATPase
MTPTRWTADELLAAEFPAPRWAVDGLIPEGLTLLCASPKFGKSWWGLGLGVAIASGGHAFGRVPVNQGDALVLALEDTAPRLQTRLHMLKGTDPLGSLHIWTTWDGIEELDAWLTEHPDCRYVCVDVLKKVRGYALKSESVYDSDYRSLEPFKELADRHRVAIVVLHHVRKAASEDFLDTVNGTHGLAGTADTVIVMSRSRMTNNAVMRITSRELAECERALNFDATTGQWLLLDGPVVLHEVGDTRKAILDVLDASATELTPAEITQATNLDRELVRKTLQRMLDDDQVGRGQGRGTYVPLSHLSLLSQPTTPSDTWDTCDIGAEGDAS